MATRWKSEKPESLILMHAHNQWSQWYSYLIEAAEELKIPVTARKYKNWSGDNSWDREWLVPAGQKKKVMERAFANRLRDWDKKHG